MSKRGVGVFWLWTGENEYEGWLLSHRENRLTARVRRLNRWTPDTGASPGNAVPLDVMERARGLSRRLGLGQSPAIESGALLEFRVVTLQPSSVANYDFVLTGTFVMVADEHLEALSRLNSNEALRYLQAKSTRPQAPQRLQIG